MITLMAQIIDFQHATDRLAQTIEPETELLFHFLGTVQESLKRLRSLVALIEDDTTLSWIFRHDDRGLRYCLTPIKGYLEMINQGLVGELTSQQKDCTHLALQCLDPIIQGFITCFTQSQKSYLTNSAAIPRLIPAETALASLWHILRYYFQDLPRFDISIPSRWPRLAYDHWQTPLLFVEVMTLLKGEPDVSGHSRRIRLDIAPTEEVLIMSICVQDLLMLPELWNQIQNRFFIEPLHELGGSIEPLVWDEGYGQGVIVRLPWAKEDV